ncbi:hypothetical protein PM082_019323 [Marasmius tenuissimus]|nr:hypothetical protein PM082_019323 [Marasmius tenuissimus]
MLAPSQQNLETMTFGVEASWDNERVQGALNIRTFDRQNANNNIYSSFIARSHRDALRRGSKKSRNGMINSEFTPRPLFPKSSFIIEIETVLLGMKVQRFNYRAQKRARIHPYLRPLFSEENRDAPYTPRIEDDSLLYLAFDVLPAQEIDQGNLIPLGVENRADDRYQEELKEMFIFLGLSLILLCLKTEMLLRV